MLVKEMNQTVLWYQSSQALFVMFTAGLKDHDFWSYYVNFRLGISVTVCAIESYCKSYMTSKYVQTIIHCTGITSQQMVDSGHLLWSDVHWTCSVQ